MADFVLEEVRVVESWGAISALDQLKTQLEILINKLPDYRIQSVFPKGISMGSDNQWFVLMLKKKHDPEEILRKEANR